MTLYIFMLAGACISPKCITFFQVFSLGFLFIYDKIYNYRRPCRTLLKKIFFILSNAHHLDYFILFLDALGNSE